MTESDVETVVDVVMPQMGVSVTEGTVVAWSRTVGDTIEMDETLCEISPDKVETEIPAPAGATLSEIQLSANETVPVGHLRCADRQPQPDQLARRDRFRYR